MTPEDWHDVSFTAGTCASVIIRKLLALGISEAEVALPKYREVPQKHHDLSSFLSRLYLGLTPLGVPPLSRTRSRFWENGHRPPCAFAVSEAFRGVVDVA
jgi:hypothetical protein